MKTLKAMLIGAAIGASLAWVDGAILGLMLGPEGATMRWGFVAAAGGAAFGGIAGFVVPRLVLKPPDKSQGPPI
jgi:hypothetical protein